MSNFDAFDNLFFAIKLSKTCHEKPSWDLIRKIPTLPGAGAELLEVIAPALVNSNECYIFISSNDQYLLSDLQNLGFQLYGFLLKSESDNSYNLWDGERDGEIITLSQNPMIYLQKREILRIVLTGKNASHDIKNNASIYFSFCISREKILLGLTKSNYDFKKDELIKRNKSTVQNERNISNFKEVISSRVSATDFDYATLTKEKLEQLFEDSYYRQINGHLPYGTAGGFNNIKLMLYSEGFNNILPGLYTINSETAEWQSLSTMFRAENLRRASFEQPYLQNAKIWIFLIIDFSEICEKYGSRSYKFSMMHIGSMIQQIHLSCVSLGLKFRAIGGFDENIINQYLSLKNNHYVACMAAIGG